jgi:hypothetical protein
MADSQYIIEISAEMTGTETISELDALTATLTGAGKKSDDFQRAVKRLTSDLDAARVASAASTAALAAGNDQYKILERDAIRAGKAVEKAQGKGLFDARAIRSAHEARAALDAYSTTLKGLEGNAAAATAKQDKLARVLGNVNKIGGHADARAMALNQKYEKMQAAVSRLPGPLGRIGGQLVGSAKGAHGMSLAFTGAQVATLALAAGVLVGVAAVVALTAVMVAGAIAVTGFAVAQADAARNARLSREAFAALSAETAAGVGTFDAVAAATGLADAELVSLTKQLRAAKVSAADMPEALMAAALAERALGAGGAGQFIDGIKDGTRTVRAFAREAEDKFGGVVAEQLRGLDAQTARLSKLWKKLFSGINVEPFLDALGVLVGMFSRLNPLADSFGGAVEGAINPIGPMALRAAYAVEAFALGFAIQLTKMYIAVKPALKWLGELFGMQDDGTTDTFKKLGEVAAIVALVFTGALAVAMGVVGAAVGVVVGAFALLGLAIYETIRIAGLLLSGLISLGTTIVSWAQTVGVDLMMGLVNGITATVGAVVQAVSNAVGSAITAAKEVLGIASPSKVFAEIGDNTVAGFTGSVDDGAAEAESSMASLVSANPGAVAAPATEAPGAGAGGGGKSAAGKSLDLSGATLNFYGVKDAEHSRDLIADVFTRLLEGDADSLNGAPA